MRLLFERRRAALNWHPERLDRRRLQRAEQFGRYGLYRLVSQSVADDCWQAELDPGAAWDLPPRVFLRRFRGQPRPAGLNDEVVHRYMMLEGVGHGRSCQLEEVTEVGVASAVPFIASINWPGASLMQIAGALRDRGQRAWLLALSVGCMGLDALDQLHQNELGHPRLGLPRVRLCLGKDAPMLQLCGGYPLGVVDGRFGALDLPPRPAAERRRLLLLVLSLTGLLEIDRAEALLADGAEAALTVLRDAVLERVPPPYDQAVAGLIDGCNARGSLGAEQVERWLGEQLDPAEVDAVWQAVAAHDLALRAR